MRDMDLIGRIEMVTALTGALRHATIIDSLISARYTAQNADDMNQIITRHENRLADDLAKIADMLGLALVNKKEGEVERCGN